MHKIGIVIPTVGSLHWITPVAVLSILNVLLLNLNLKISFGVSHSNPDFVTAL